MKIIAGLGNPGAKYTFTHHNAGFLFIDYISQKYNIPVDRLKFKALCGQGVIAGERVMLIKPQTFMNLSGEAVRAALDFYKLDSSSLIVAYDDIAIPVGRMRIRPKGSDGGHNGIKSIIQMTGSDSFDRIRFGCGVERHEDFNTVDFVLSQFSGEEKKIIFDVFTHASDALELIVKGEIESAQSKYNGIDCAPKPPKEEMPQKAEDTKGK